MPCNRTGARMRPVLLRAAAAVAALAVLAGCAGQSSAESGNSGDRYVGGDGSSASYAPQERESAPEVAGRTLGGDRIELADYEGDVLVVNFWASWCAPCRAETPVLVEAYTEYQDRGVEFLGINIKDEKTAATAFEENLGVPYPSLYDQPGKVPQAFRESVPPQAIPSTLILDEEGRIAAKVIGATDYNELTGLLDSLAEPAGGSADS